MSDDPETVKKLGELLIEMGALRERFEAKDAKLAEQDAEIALLAARLDEMTAGVRRIAWDAHSAASNWEGDAFDDLTAIGDELDELTATDTEQSKGEAPGSSPGHGSAVRAGMVDRPPRAGEQCGEQSSPSPAPVSPDSPVCRWTEVSIANGAANWATECGVGVQLYVQNADSFSACPYCAKTLDLVHIGGTGRPIVTDREEGTE